MMKRLLVFTAGMLAFLFPSCTSVNLADQAVLNRTAMKFDTKGARSAACTLVSQVEKGRALSNTSAGGACASCQ